MLGHFCQEHQVKYSVFKKGDDIWWSHKTATGWCNENKSLPEKKLPVAKVEQIKETTKVETPKKVIDIDTCKRRSIAFSYSRDLVVVGVVELKELFVYADKILEYIEK